MSIESWVLFGVLLMVFIGTVTQFGRLVKFLLELHRNERKEYTQSTNKVLGSLETAIREAAGTTNIFHADGQVGNNSGKTSINRDLNGDFVQGNQTKEETK